ncbi:MAG: hypothetical protein KHZ62_11735, partial [Clostridiales bacterium]|nr:hypothetical protein [Clostridiales bacterium]
MAAALNLLRALPLNPSKVLPPFAFLAQRTSSPLYSRQTKRNSCRCPFDKISVPSVFQKSSESDFVKIKKPTQFQLLQKSKIHRLNPLT